MLSIVKHNVRLIDILALDGDRPSKANSIWFPITVHATMCAGAIPILSNAAYQTSEVSVPVLCVSRGRGDSMFNFPHILNVLDGTESTRLRTPERNICLSPSRHCQSPFKRPKKPASPHPTSGSWNLPRRNSKVSRAFGVLLVRKSWSRSKLQGMKSRRNWHSCAILRVPVRHTDLLPLFGNSSFAPHLTISDPSIGPSNLQPENPRYVKCRDTSPGVNI